MEIFLTIIFFPILVSIISTTLNYFIFKLFDNLIKKYKNNASLQTCPIILANIFSLLYVKLFSGLNLRRSK